MNQIHSKKKKDFLGSFLSNTEDNIVLPQLTPPMLNYFGKIEKFLTKLSSFLLPSSYEPFPFLA